MKNNPPSFFFMKLKRFLIWALLFLVPATVFFVIISSYSQKLIRLSGTLILTDYKYALPVLGLLFLFFFSLRGWQGKFAALTTSCLVFGLALSGLWANGFSDSNIVMGFFPVGDAGGYYQDALRLINGIPFSSFASRRPLFTSFFASVLFVFGQKISFATAVITLINGFCCFEFAWTVRKKWGPVAGTITLLILFFFFRRFIGSIMSETIGLALGSLGLSLFLAGIRLDTKFQINWLGLLGIFTFSIGLLARAGTFIILPCLIIWILFKDRKGRSLNWKQTGAAAGAMIAAFGVNTLIYKFLGSPEQSVPFANFFFSFYGLINGGTSWEQVFIQHPELNLMPEAQQVRLIYQLCLDILRSNPLLLVKGIFTEYYYFLSPTWYNAYSYFLPETEIVGFFIQYTLITLMFLGVLVSFVRRKQPTYQFILVISIGFFLSIPFVPPRDTNRMRAYATSIPILAVLPSLGTAWVLEKLKKMNFLIQKVEDDSFFIAPGLAIFLLSFVLIVPFAIRTFHVRGNSQVFPCPELQKSLLVRYQKENALLVRGDDEPFVDDLPKFHRSSFVQGLHDTPYQDLVTTFSDVPAPFQLTNVLDIYQNTGVWLIIPDRVPFSGNSGLYNLCGNYMAQLDTFTPNYSLNLFSVETATAVTVKK